MNFRSFLAACWLLAQISHAGLVFRFTDDFSKYPDGSGGEPGWDVNDLGFEVKAGAFLADVKGQRGVAFVKDAPPGKDLTIEALVTPRLSQHKEWRTAGVSVMVDDRNFWHIALAESPDGSRRFIELSEMLDGVWNAQNETGSVARILEDAGPFEWKYGASYRLRLTIDHTQTPARIIGEVFEGETSRFRCVRALDGKAVNHGRPALLVNTLPAVFDDVSVSITTSAPPEKPAEFPKFQSSPLAAGPQRKASGFFRVEETSGKWWLIDPAGKSMLSIGTDHVSYQSHWCEALGFAPYHKIVEKKFGGEKPWAEDAVKRLKAWNFTSLGTNPSPEACKLGLAHAEALGIGAAFSSVAALVEKTTWTGFPDVFDPRFERFCELRARKLCAPRSDDPWLIGYYIDNELEWWGKSHRPWGLVEEIAKLPATSAGKQALVASLRRSFGDDIARLNAAFGSSFSGFEPLLQPFDLPQPSDDKAKAALDAFIHEVAERYFRISTAAVRRHDPNHLLLGCRFAHDAPDAAWRQAGATCDVVTVNVYPRVDLRTAEVIGFEDHLKAKFALCKRPMILTEWGFPSLDAVDRDGKPLPCTKGAGMRVDTVYQKARCYAAVQRSLFSLPFMVGSHYFMWSDEPSLGISEAFPENSSYGLVNEMDEPYLPLVETATRVNALAHDLHAGKIRAADIDPGDASPIAEKSSPLPQIGTRVTLEKTASGCVIDTGTLRAVKDKPGDAIFNRIEVRYAVDAPWLELGSFTFVPNILKGNTKDWPHPDQAPEFTVISQNDRKVVLEVETARRAEPSFRVRERLTFHAGRPFFEARILWIENSSDAAWSLASYLHYLPSRIAGDASNDELGVAAVPNYWLKIATWRDPQAALHYGAFVSNNDRRLDCYFWKDSVQHPDCMRKVAVDLQARQRWTADADEPSVIIFGLREDTGNPRPWRNLLPLVESLE